MTEQMTETKAELDTKSEIKKSSLADVLKKVPAWLFWALLSLIIVVAAVVSVSNSSEKSNAQQAKEITKQLRCLECEGLSVYDSDTKNSKSIARDVARRVASGESDSDIFSYYEGIYGEFILLAPTPGSGNWLIYVVPGFFVVVFLGAIFLSIKKNVSFKTQIAFWVLSGLLLVVGIGLFVNDSKSETKKEIATNNKSTEELLQQSVDESPNNGNYRSLAIVQFAKEKYVDALQNFDSAAELNLQDAESRGYAAYIVFLSGEYDLATDRAQKAVEANSQDPTALFFRGLIKFQTPQEDAAIKKANEDAANKDFDAVLRIAPQSNFAEQIRSIRS